MHFDEPEVLPPDASPLEGAGHGEYGAHEQLLARIDGGDRVRANEGQWCLAERARRVGGHQQDGRRAVSQRRSVSGCHRPVSPIKYWW
jgi:hypothetical protein